MNFQDRLAETDAQTLHHFNSELVKHIELGKPVLASAVLAADTAGLPLGECMDAVAHAHCEGAPLSQALGWDWLREWEVRAQLLTGLAQHEFA